MFSKNLWFLVGLELLIANDRKLEKTADISRCHCRFPPKMSLPRSGHSASSVWNDCTHFSDIISWGNQWWHHEMSAVFWGYIFISFVLSLLLYITCSFTEPREEWFETHSSSNFNKWFFVFFFHFSTTKSTDILVFFSGLLKMLSFGFQKLKIFLLLKTLERFVTDCHLNPLMFKQFFSLDKKVVFKLTFQRDCGVFGSLFLLN